MFFIESCLEILSQTERKKILVFIYLKNNFFSVFSDCLRIRVRRWRSIFRRQWLIENNYVANSIIQWKFLFVKVQVDFGRKIDVNHSQLTERCNRDKKKLFVTVVQLWKKLRKITCYFTFLIIQFFSSTVELAFKFKWKINIIKFLTI